MKPIKRPDYARIIHITNDEAQAEQIKTVPAHYGLNVTALVRFLVKREADAIAKR